MSGPAFSFAGEDTLGRCASKRVRFAEEDKAMPTVLLVDDDDSVTRSLARMLASEPFDVVTTNHPAQALDILKARSVDVIVSDENMPELSGADLLSRIRADHPDVVRVLLTGENDIRAAASAVNDGGVFRFLLKPCQRQLFVSTLHDAVAFRSTLPEDRAKLSRAFEEALALLWLAQQPIVEYDGTIAASELLLRSGADGFKGPEWFLHSAATIGRSAELEAAIAVEVVKNLELFDDRLLFVNVDPGALMREDLFAPLRSYAGRIVLEITERDALGDRDRVGDRIRELKARGFRIAVDDLGSGYSGLNAVVDLMPDVIKLDMQLVRDVDTSFVKERLVTSISTAARELGIRVVAEGIERPEELRKLIVAGCDLFQGYLIARPSTAPPEGLGPITIR
jgi:EAL domain-containing protein (putative c-di-GMP-specific phosphodiesterase class I)